MPTQREELQQNLQELEALLQEPGLTATARRRIQSQIEETQNNLLALQVGGDLGGTTSLEEQIAAKERELSVLKAQLPGYVTHPDQWDEHGRLVSNVLNQ